MAGNQTTSLHHTAIHCWQRIALIAACALCVCALAFTTNCSPAPETATAPEKPGTEFSDPADTQENRVPSSNTPTPSAEPTLDDKVAEKVASMTTEHKVAQMFVVRPEDITGVETATVATSITSDALHAYPVGGIAYFQKNLIDPDQTRTMLANSQSYAHDACGLPLFTAVDEEGGTVSRIGGNPGFGTPNVGNMVDIGATGDPAQATAVATTIANYLRDLGFNVDFAPDSDICGDPATDVMALRSFGTDPNLVASMVSAQVQGFSGAGMLCSVKHFPGIGGLMGDSHEGAIVSEKSLDDLRAWELVPFKAAIASKVPFVMVGHLSAPNAFGDNTPTSINHAAVTDLLRNELGFQNLIITDSMAMGAVDGYCTPDQAGVIAIQAGVDIVLMPADFKAAYQGVLDAVNSGAISQARLDESVTRIVKAKMALA